MGGGAGVEFTLTISGFSFTTRGGKVQPSRPVEIESWDCVGYMDGMNNIRGDMLKVKRVYLDTDDIKYLREEGVRPSEYVGVSKFKVSNMEWGGYIRGKWQDAFPMTLTGTAEIDTIGETNIAVEVDVTDKEEFGNFWQDVFEFYAEEGITDADDNEVSFEEQYDIINDDCRVNYGAKTRK